jgi:murein DD-endopeptidase MepM/ murein hydrolase activator NlpD
MLFMQIMYYKHSAIVAIGLLISVQLSAQSVDSSAVNWHLDQVDSTQQVRDSLEVVMLRTTQSYQQVERLLNSLPAYRLNLLPSVLPVDVPIDRFRVSSRFGYRIHPIHRQTRFHRGVDVSAPLGMVVKATAEGVVKRVGHDPSLGVFVQLQHAFGFETIYGHLSGYCVRPGQTVSRNQELGRVGKTGLATGPHLHYRNKKNGSDVDPFNFCFLLRRRLYLEKSKTSGASVTDSVNRVSSRGE